MDTKKILLATAIAASLALTACGGDGADDGLGTDTAAMDGAAADAGAFQDPLATDQMGGDMAGETLALVMAVDQHEVAMAEQARGKNLQGEVLEYANTLHEDHTANLEKDRQVATQSGITVNETDAVMQHKQKGQATMERLAGLEGEAYADAFVEAMVEGHQEALDTIDARMADVTQPELQQHLSATRDVIARHLEQGQALQGEGEDSPASIAQ